MLCFLLAVFKQYFALVVITSSVFTPLYLDKTSPAPWHSYLLIFHLLCISKIWIICSNCKNNLVEHTFCNRPAYPEDLKICKTIVTADIVFARSRLICMTYDPTRGWRKWSEWIKQNRIFGLDHPLCRRPHHTDDLDDLQNRLKQAILIVKLTSKLLNMYQKWN